VFAFVLRFDKKNKVCLEIEKPYFQHINLSRKSTHLIFTLLRRMRRGRPFCSQIKSLLNIGKVTAIFTVIIFVDNILIYCCLIFNNLKQSYFTKSLNLRDGIAISYVETIVSDKN